MCLSSNDSNTLIVKEAYKVFETRKNNKLNGIFYEFPFIKRRWLTDTSTKCHSIDAETSYLTGFHCFVNKHYALNYCAKDLNEELMQPHEVCHRVLVKEIVASGWQSDFPESQTIVARQIYIMEEVK